MNKITAKIDDGWKKIESLRGLNRFEWIVLSVVLVNVFFVFMIYTDIQATSMHAYAGQKAFFTLSLDKFYETVIRSNTPYFRTAAYEITVYIIFMIWMIPLRLVSMVSGVEIFTSDWCFYYIALLLLGFCFLLVRVFCLIAQEMGFSKEDKRFSLFLGATSLCGFIFPVLITKQYDIFCLVFVLFGVWSYIRGNSWLFVLFFSISITMKFFPILIYIPLVLYREKRLGKVVLQLIGGLILLFLLSFFYSGNLSYYASTEPFKLITVSQVLSGGTFISGYYGDHASFFFITYIFLCVYAYEQKDEKIDIFCYKTIWIALAAFSTFFLFENFHPHWILFTLPFTLLLIVKKSAKVKLLVILNTVIEGSLFFITSLKFPGAYRGESLLNHSFLRYWFQPAQVPLYESLSDLWKDIGLADFSTVFYSIFVGGTLTFLFVCFPRKITESSDSDQAINIEKGYLWIRILMPVAASFLIIFGYFTPRKDSVVFDSITHQNLISSTTPLIDDLRRFRQDCFFDQDMLIEQIEISMTPYALIVDNSESVDLSITNAETGEVLCQTGQSLFVGNGTSLVFSPKSCVIAKNQKYGFELQGKWGRGWDYFLAYSPMDQFQTFENDQIVPYDWGMKITARPVAK